MKSRKPLLAMLAAGTWLVAGVLYAQDMSAAKPDAVVLETAQGQVTIKSVPGALPASGPAPSFSQLANGGKFITEEQAAAYPPLANDYVHADANRNGKVTKAEYEHWVSKL
jgi:hypothetical protein